MKITRDLFLIPEGDGALVYAPLRRALFWADNSACQNIKDWISGIRHISSRHHKEIEYLEYIESIETIPQKSKSLRDRDHLIIIPSQICNFSCTYCYAKRAHSKDVISQKQLTNAIDSILGGRNTHKRFTFIGGGEPLMAWDIITSSIEYIKENKRDTDNIHYGITTNGTLFNKEIIEYCKENKIRINISFEVIKEIQDRQRPFTSSRRSTFDIIDKNIKELVKHGVSCSIRATITSLNVDRMSDMAEAVGSNYSGVKGLHLEQVTDSSEGSSLFYSKFITNFFEAKRIAEQYGLRITNSITNSIDSIKERFCPGELCLTPTGSIVACHRISSEKDIGYDLFRYGTIDEKGIHIDDNCEKRYLAFSSLKQSECSSCFALWHCAGICPMERMYLSNKHIKNKCNFTREMIKQELIYRLTRGRMTINK